MAMDAGNAADNTGLAGTISSTMEAAFGEPFSEEAKQANYKFADVLAASIVSYIKFNADVRIKATDSGLQKSTVIGAATAAPDSDVVLAGAIE